MHKNTQQIVCFRWPSSKNDNKNIHLYRSLEATGIRHMRLTGHESPGFMPGVRISCAFASYSED